MDDKTRKQMAKMVDVLQPHCDEQIVAAMTCSHAGSMGSLLISRLLGGGGGSVQSVRLPNPVFIAVGPKSIYAFDYAPKGFNFKIKKEVTRWPRDKVRVESKDTLLVKPGPPLIWRGPMLNSAIRQFLIDVEWGELDYLIVDLPPGTGEAALSLVQALPLSGAVIVTLPQLVSLEDAGRGINMFRTLEVPILGIVENMSYLELPDGTRMDIFGTGGGEHLAHHVQANFLGKVPIDQHVRIGGDTGKPIVVTDPESAAAQALTEIAKKIAAQVSVAALSTKNELPINIVE